MDQKENTYDYLIVGSGFGGSVSAMRLAEKGYSVVVLERGKRYHSDDFPVTNWNLRKFLWMPKLFMYGIQCLTLLKDVFILHGSGVGGGSLVYANTLLVPDRKIFKNWKGGEWAERLSPFYRSAKKMLGANKSPLISPSDETFQESFKDMGKGDDCSSVDVGIFFGTPGKTVEDPYYDGKGPDRAGCIFCGGCMVGCRYNAKNTLDKNYLYFAEQNGARIIPETEVQIIEKSEKGRFIIKTKKSTGILPRHSTFLTRNVIISAGVIGSVKLLERCRLKRSIKDIPASLGHRVRTNSEALIGVVSGNKDVDYSQGIAISAKGDLDENTQVEPVRYGAGQDVMGLLATVLTSGGPGMPRIIRWVLSVVTHPIQTLKNLWPFGWAKKTTILLVMQTLDNYLRLTYKRRWWRLGGRTLNSERNTPERIPTYIPQANKLARVMADKLNGRACGTLPESILNTATTAHILGGCCLGDAPGNSVVDENLKVFGHDDLYVIDGSVIPGNLGVNPSLTITAIAEWAMSRIPDNPNQR